MKRLSLALVFVALVAFVHGGLTHAADSETLTGQLVWNNEDQKGPSRPSSPRPLRIIGTSLSISYGTGARTSGTEPPRVA